MMYFMPALFRRPASRLAPTPHRQKLQWGLSVLLIFGLVLGTSGHLVADAWQLNSTADGITVYTRSVDNSKYNAFKGTIKVESTLAGIVQLLDDAYSRCHSWMKRCILRRKLAQQGPLSIYYSATQMPWPLKNRDTIVQARFFQDPATKAITIDLLGLPSYLEVSADFERIAALSGRWQLIPIADGRVNVTYTLHVDPGGNIPALAYNPLVARQPRVALGKLREVLPSYRTQTSAAVKEPPKR